MSRGEGGELLLRCVWGGACCLVERGSKTTGSKYLPRSFKGTWMIICYVWGKPYSWVARELIAVEEPNEAELGPECMAACESIGKNIDHVFPIYGLKISKTISESPTLSWLKVVSRFRRHELFECCLLPHKNGDLYVQFLGPRLKFSFQGSNTAEDTTKVTHKIVLKDGIHHPVLKLHPKRKTKDPKVRVVKWIDMEKVSHDVQTIKLANYNGKMPTLREAAPPAKKKKSMKNLSAGGGYFVDLKNLRTSRAEEIQNELAWEGKKTSSSSSKPNTEVVGFDEDEEMEDGEDEEDEEPSSDQEMAAADQEMAAPVFHMFIEQQQRAGASSSNDPPAGASSSAAPSSNNNDHPAGASSSAAPSSNGAKQQSGLLQRGRGAPSSSAAPSSSSAEQQRQPSNNGAGQQRRRLFGLMDDSLSKQYQKLHEDAVKLQTIGGFKWVLMVKKKEKKEEKGRKRKRGKEEKGERAAMEVQEKRKTVKVIPPLRKKYLHLRLKFRVRYPDECGRKDSIFTRGTKSKTTGGAESGKRVAIVVVRAWCAIVYAIMNSCDSFLMSNPSTWTERTEEQLEAASTTASELLDEEMDKLKLTAEERRKAKEEAAPLLRKTNFRGCFELVKESYVIVSDSEEESEVDTDEEKDDL